MMKSDGVQHWYEVHHHSTVSKYDTLREAREEARDLLAWNAEVAVDYPVEIRSVRVVQR